MLCDCNQGQAHASCVSGSPPAAAAELLPGSTHMSLATGLTWAHSNGAQNCRSLWLHVWQYDQAATRHHVRGPARQHHLYRLAAHLSMAGRSPVNGAVVHVVVQVRQGAHGVEEQLGAVAAADGHAPVAEGAQPRDADLRMAVLGVAPRLHCLQEGGRCSVVRCSVVRWRVLQVRNAAASHRVVAASVAKLVSHQSDTPCSTDRLLACTAVERHATCKV